MMQSLSKHRGPTLSAFNIFQFGSALLLAVNFDKVRDGILHDYRTAMQKPAVVEEIIGLLITDWALMNG